MKGKDEDRAARSRHRRERLSRHTQPKKPGLSGLAKAPAGRNGVKSIDFMVGVLGFWCPPMTDICGVKNDGLFLRRSQVLIQKHGGDHAAADERARKGEIKHDCTTIATSRRDRKRHNP